MPAPFKTYNPALVTVSFNGINITGFMDGTFIKAQRDEAAFTKQIGSVGDGTRTKNMNKGGKVTLTLVQASVVNDALADLALRDEEDGDKYGPLQIKDLSGTMYCRALNAWIEKMPDIERAKEAGSVEWQIDCHELEIFPGGNIQ